MVKYTISYLFRKFYLINILTIRPKKLILNEKEDQNLIRSSLNLLFEKLYLFNHDPPTEITLSKTKNSL